MHGLDLEARVEALERVAILLERPDPVATAELSRRTRLTRAKIEEIMSGVQFPWPIKEMILQHHERLDGSGDPQRRTAPSFSLAAQVLAAADMAFEGVAGDLAAAEAGRRRTDARRLLPTCTACGRQRGQA